MDILVRKIGSFNPSNLVFKILNSPTKYEAIVTLGQRSWTIELMIRWLDRSHGKVSCRLTQVLTVHDCFNSFLHNINRLPSFVWSFNGTPRSCLKKKDSAYYSYVIRHSKMTGKYSSIGSTRSSSFHANLRPPGRQTWILLRRSLGSRQSWSCAQQ